MKVLLFGHSYVKDLKNLGYKSFVSNNVTFQLEYLYQPGGSYELFLNDHSLLNSAFEYQPDFIIVIIGGNALNNSKPDEEIRKQCRDFYQMLRNGLPNTTIIAAQLELRFYESNNRWNAPDSAEYLRRRNNMNTFLKRLKLKDALMMVAGKNRIDCASYYRDGVHLNRVGLIKYFDFIKCTLAYQYRKSH